MVSFAAYILLPQVHTPSNSIYLSCPALIKTHSAECADSQRHHYYHNKQILCELKCIGLLPILEKQTIGVKQYVRIMSLKGSSILTQVGGYSPHRISVFQLLLRMSVSVRHDWVREKKKNNIQYKCEKSSVTIQRK